MINKEIERYSFSKLSSFHTCPYGYKLTYIDHQKGEQNAFALYGTLVHSIMERYANNKLDLWDLPMVYEAEFEESVNLDFPEMKYLKKSLKELYYEQGLEFLRNFAGYDKYKILEVESEFNIQIDDWIFNGFIDLVYEDDEGNLVLLDYKSKSGFKNKQEQYKYARQLYLYSIYLHKKYGKYPDIMKFYTFRKQTQIDIPFNEDDFSEALIWAKYTVKKIRSCKEFLPKCDEFYANNLCNHRNNCEHKIE